MEKIVFSVIGIYLILCLVAYYFIFRKHHKRNNISLDEEIHLFPKFLSITTISIAIIALGFYFFYHAALNTFDREEVVKSIILGIFAISATVINYINYLKRNLQDLDQEIHEENRKKDIKISEIILLIVFLILALTPLYKIPTFIRLFDFKKEFYIELGKSLLITISSLFLLFNINPLNFKEKIFKRKGK